MEAAKKKLLKLKERLEKKKIAKVDKEEGKSIALGTSKLVSLPEEEEEEEDDDDDDERSGGGTWVRNF